MPGGGRPYLIRPDSCWERQHRVAGICTMSHKQEKTVLTVGNFCDSISKTSDRITLQILIPLIMIFAVCLSEKTRKVLAEPMMKSTQE